MPKKSFDILAKLKCKFNFKIPVQKQSKGKGRKKISSLAKSEKIEPETAGGSRALPKSVEPHSELECYTTATSSSTRSNRLQKPTAGTQVPDLRGDIERILAEQGLPLHNFGANAPKEGSDRIQATIDPALLSDNDLPADWRNEPIFDDPNKLCCFCDEELPQAPSEKLTKLGNYLKNLPEVRSRIELSNPLALHLPFPRTAGYCQLHRAEATVIPEGIERGWPSRIDFDALNKRVKSYEIYFRKVFAREIPSSFMDAALKGWNDLGPTKVRSIFSEMGTLELEQPGYYGVQGYQEIYRALHSMFLDTTHLAPITALVHPVSPDYLVRKAMLPEAAMCLIAEDLQTCTTDPLVMRTLEESRAFGTAMFPDND